MTKYIKKEPGPAWLVWYRYVDPAGRALKLQCLVNAPSYAEAGERLKATYDAAADITILEERK